MRGTQSRVVRLSATHPSKRRPAVRKGSGSLGVSLAVSWASRQWDRRSRRATIAWYDAESDVWEIGVMPWCETEPPRIHGVLVDAVTGEIRGPLDRPWDRDVDPFP